MSYDRTCLLHPDTGLLILVEDVSPELYKRIVEAEAEAWRKWESHERNYDGSTVTDQSGA